MKKRVVLYTDGACSGNPGIGGYAGILIYGNVRREYNGGELSTTNNRMEVQAVIVGLSRLKYPCAVDVYSDSSYTVNAFANRWIYAWKKNGWKKADGKAVQNVDLWEQLYALTQTHEVTFHKVRVFRRSAPTRRHRPRPCLQPGIHRLRRTDFRAGRFHSGAGHQHV